MKVLTIRRLMLVLGLTIGLMVVWAAATPSAFSANSLIGGWYPVSGCPKCTGTDSSSPDAQCPKGRWWEPDGPLLGCAGGDLTICLVGGTGSKCCGPEGNPICNDNNGQGDPVCNGIHDASCTTDNCP